MMGFEPTLCLRWYIKRASLLDIPIIFGASANLTLGFLLQDIFHHDLRFIALCPSSELHPYIVTTAGFQPATLSRPDPYSGAVMQLRFTWPLKIIHISITYYLQI